MSAAATIEGVLGRSEPKLNRQTRISPWSEAPVWQPMPSGWRHLYGGFDEVGISIEWHDFELSSIFEWSRSFHPDSLELCLNLAGRGSVCHGDETLDFEPMTAGFYAPGRNALEARRLPG